MTSFHIKKSQDKDYYGKHRIGRFYLLWRKINSQFSYRRMIRQAVSELDLKKGDNIIDIACGPGYNFKNIFEKIGTTGHITAIDYSPYMLEVAQKRTKKF